ncbi:MAG: valine--tRNA ligase, partial [Treponema sp.]|nr:valine--tRNA ligase [Treponema sp.]
EANFAFLQDLVRMVRTLRSECTITPDKKIRILVRIEGALSAVLRENENLVKLLAGIGELEIEGSAETQGAGDAPSTLHPLSTHPQGSIGLAGKNFEVFVFLGGAVDTAALTVKFKKDLEKDKKFTGSLQAKLRNDQFVKNAPAELVAAEKDKLEEAEKRIKKIESYIRDMEGSA